MTLAVRDHPAVVALYYDHTLDVRERPLWNVGSEWHETVLSTDPLAVRVTTEVGNERLALYVGRDLSVLHVERDELTGDVDREAGEPATA